MDKGSYTMESTCAEQTMNRQDVARLLSETSAKTYYVEYEGFMYNHIGHGIIALSRLAASSQRIQRFLQWYIPKLEPADKHISAETEIVAEPEKLLGARKAFYALYAIYEKELASNGGSLEQLIAKKLPVLGRGLAGSALHGIIQLGYGYSARNEIMVCEGLAYMHSTYVAPIISTADSLHSTGKPSYSFLDMIDQVRDDVTLSQLIRDEIVKPEWEDIKLGNFQRYVQILFRYSGDRLMGRARRIRLPSGVIDTSSLARWMVNNAITVYATSERRNDFFLLHGVTGAWGLLQVITLIGDSTIERELIMYYTCTLLAAYTAQGAPKLLLDSLHDNNSYGIKLRQSWDTVIQDALSIDYDEHIYKLIQVCHDMDDGNTDAELTRLYMTAASVALDNPFNYSIKPKDF